jgi:hypothetical protein
MADLDEELSSYDAQRLDLERQYSGKWVVFHGTDRIGIFDTLEIAAREAAARFDRGPYLIREIGAPPISLPSCIVQSRDDERSAVRL